MTMPPESYSELIGRLQDGENFSFYHFYGHKQKHPRRIDRSCFSQWFHCPFKIDGIHYPTAEHWMMAEKARLFADFDTLELILTAPDPKTAKQLGRSVKNFNSDVWSSSCFDIVVRGNVAKFGQNEEILHFLQATGNDVMVEAAANDSIWGIGLSVRDANAHSPEHWRGQNLLGFALNATRRILSMK